jgi:hypothetical protein
MKIEKLNRRHGSAPTKARPIRYEPLKVSRPDMDLGNPRLYTPYSFNFKISPK